MNDALVIVDMVNDFVTGKLACSRTLPGDRTSLEST